MLQNESFKKMKTNKNTSIKRTTSKASYDFMQTKSDLLSSDKFVFKF